MSFGDSRVNILALKSCGESALHSCVKSYAMFRQWAACRLHSPLENFRYHDASDTTMLFFEHIGLAEALGDPHRTNTI